MRSSGLPILPGGWKKTPKLFFALCRRTDIAKAPPAAAEGGEVAAGAAVDRGLPTREAARSFPKKMLRDGGGMNNFCIVLATPGGGNDRGGQRDVSSASGGGARGGGGGGKAAAAAANKKKRKKKTKQDAK